MKATSPNQPEAGAGDPNFMESLARGLSVLRAFSEHRRSLTISQVAQLTALSRASARRCLYTLSSLGYVAEDHGRYTLRPLVLSLGSAYLASTPLAEIAQPVLDDLSRALGESCSVAVLDGDDIVYVARSAESRIISISLLVGTRLPAYCTAMGQVLLAALSEQERAAYLLRAKLVARTGRTLTTTSELANALDLASARGFASLDQELEDGLRSVAVPVRNVKGVVVAGMNVAAHASSVSMATMEEEFLPRLQHAAIGLAATLL